MVNLGRPEVLSVGAGRLERSGESDWRYISMKVLIIYDSVFGNTEVKFKFP